MGIALLFLSALLLTSTSSEGTDERVASKKTSNILLVSDSMFGHLAGLLPVGGELAQRGHNVTILLALHDNEQDRYRSHIGRHGINLWSVSPEDTPKLNVAKLHREHSLSEILTVLEYQAGFFKVMAKHLNRSLSRGEWDIVMADQFQQDLVSCMRSIHSVPFVISTHLTLSIHLHPLWPWPAFGATSDDMGFLDRVLSVPARLALEVFNYARFYAAGSVRAEYCPSVSIRSINTDPGVHIPAIVFSVIGLEYARTISPLTEYVGALAPKNPAPLTGELAEWLGKKSERSVVYISMGSMFSIDEKDGKALLEGVMNTNFSLLWSLRESNQWILEGLDIDSDRVLISPWTPQFSVLQSSTIHSAILHGGLHGLNDALSNGVPVMVFPQMPEQLFNGGRVHFNRFGILLRGQISSETISSSIQAIDRGDYQSKVSKLQKIYRLAGGAERAADLVEFYETVGYAHLVPAYAKYQWSWIQYYNADVYAVLMVTLAAVGVCCLACCRCLYRRCCSAKHKEKKE